MRRFAYAVIHWAARCAALLVTGTFLLLLGGNFLNPDSPGPTHFREWAGIVLLIAAIIGMLAAWKWELRGALLSLLTLAAFVPVAGMHRYTVVGFAAIPGILFLGDWLLRRQRRESVLR
jgi:hypothetical protein